MPDQDAEIVGYSILELFEECYVYNEDECYIAATRDLAIEFMNRCFYSPDECRIDPVTLGDMINDYGCSSGSFALDLQAFARFVELAKIHDLQYEAKEWYMDPSIKVVSIQQKPNA